MHQFAVAQRQRTERSVDESFNVISEAEPTFAWFMAAENGDIYEVTLVEGELTAVTPGIWAKASIEAGEDWLANHSGQEITWRVVSTVAGGPAMQSPSGHAAHYLLVNADDAEHHLFIDTFGFAEEVFTDDSGIYRAGDDSINPPGEEPTSVTIADATFVFANSATIDHPFVKPVDATFRGYWGQLPDGSEEYVWQSAPLSVTVENRAGMLPVRVLTVTNVSAGNSNEERRLFATADDGAVHELAYTGQGDDFTVTGLRGVVGPATVVVGSSWVDRVGLTWTITALQQPEATPTGYLNTIVAESDGNPQLRYFDANGVAEEVYADRSGIYRVGDGIAPPTEASQNHFTVDGVTFISTSTIDVANNVQLGAVSGDSPKVGDFHTPITLRGYRGQLSGIEYRDIWSFVNVELMTSTRSRLLNAYAQPAR